MLLANMAKSDDLKRILTLKRSIPKGLSTSAIAIDQLMDCFVKGAGGTYNKDANYDYLAYLFADVAKVGVSRFLIGLELIESSSAKARNISPLYNHMTRSSRSQSL
jgi:hypothetical protein